MPSSPHPSFEVPEGQIKALIQLLSDQNEEIVHAISQRLIMVGEPAIPFLKNAERMNPELADRITQVIQGIQFAKIEKGVEQLVAQADPELDLETGVFLLAQWAYPHIDVSPYVQTLNDWAREIQQQISPHLPPNDATTYISRFLFEKKGFRGNTEAYYDPDNSFLNRVLDRRLGIPISLSVLFILIAKRLDMVIMGIGMPGHFLVKAPSDQNFLDCFNAGAILTMTDCKKILEGSGHQFDPRYLLPISHALILARMARNLQAIYEKRLDPNRVSQLVQLIHILENPTQRIEGMR